jgi:hypothetical protein
MAWYYLTLISWYGNKNHAIWGINLPMWVFLFQMWEMIFSHQKLSLNC